MKIVTTDEMRVLEKATDAAGWTYDDMMERAGAAVAAAAQEYLENAAAGSVLVLVGPGNNGGDGLVAARGLAEAGWPVRVYLWKRTPGKSDTNYRRVLDLDIPVTHANDDPQRATLGAWLAEATVLIDALLGTGASRPIDGDLAEILDAARTSLANEPRLITLPPDDESVTASGPALFNASDPLWALSREAGGEARPLHVIAVDCVSGLDLSTGVVDPHALPAAVTVTFAYPKRGHFTGQGIEVTGTLLVADIGVPPDLAAHLTTELTMAPDVAARLPLRPRHAHKGTFGRALIVAGSVYYTGAAALAASAAMRAGAGLVTLAVPRPLQGILAATLYEVTWLPLPHDMGVLAADAARLLNEKLGQYKALLIGPGLSTEKETGEFLKAFFQPEEPKARSRPQIGFARPRGETADEAAPEKQSTARAGLPPLVVDADALNWLATQENWPSLLPPNSILTPHPGEMARLCGLASADEVSQQRWELATQKAAAWNQIVLLKGAHTIVAAPDGRVRVLPFATPALATAGTGDVLAGTIVSLLAQGLQPFDAAVVGAYLHGLAGSLAAVDVGPAGVVASDVVASLPQARQTLLD